MPTPIKRRPVIVTKPVTFHFEESLTKLLDDYAEFLSQDKTLEKVSKTEIVATALRRLVDADKDFKRPAAKKKIAAD